MNFTIVDPYASIVFSLPMRLTIQAGLRLNHHSEYGSQIVYDISPSYHMKLDETMNFKVYGSFSTSYVTPSLFQLFSVFGNKELNPEEIQNFEIGGSLYRENFVITTVYFSRKDVERIGFRSFFDDMDNFIGEYYNMPGMREVHGIELESSVKVSKHISFKGMYSFATTSNLSTFYRIPKQKVALTASTKWKNGFASNIRYLYTGRMKDLDFSSFEEVTLDAFHLFDLSASKSFFENKLTIYTSCNNIFDVTYRWAPGYNAASRNFTIGITYGF
jgi:vitamin B12 transporter